MSEPIWTVHPNAAAMADAASATVEDIARDAIRKRGRATLAFPGGRTPEPVFEHLRRKSLDWNRVTILPSDDRLVAADHPLSNFALLHRQFEASGARLVPLVQDADFDHRRAGYSADYKLQSLAWPLDLVWLGVGSDGHTASIFPGPDLAAALDEANPRRAIGVQPEPLPPEAPVARVTLTSAAIRSARHILLTITGAAKRTVVEHALEQGTRSASPIGPVLANVPASVAIHWSPA